MADIQKQLLKALRDLETSVQQIAAGQAGPGLQARFAEIDRLAGELPLGSSSTLLHYLHRKSYHKARLWLEGLDGENQAGTCRR